jgi:ribosomal protein L21E
VQQCQVYATAITKAGGKVPPRRVIKSVIKEIEQYNRTSKENPYSEGDFVKIYANINPSLRKYNGYWGVIIHKTPTSCLIHISAKNTEIQCDIGDIIQVMPNHIADIKAINKRISNLIQQDNLSSVAIGILEILGQQSSFSLDDLWFLERVEEHYQQSQN